MSTPLTTTLSEQFDEDYFLRGVESGKSLYSNYRWLPELTIPMAQAIVDHLRITTRDSILDFGCARGYLVRALRQIGYNAWGHDTSRWAVDNADEIVKPYIVTDRSVLRSNNFNWVIAKDVLEHIPSDEIDSIVDDLKEIARVGIFAIIPLAHGQEYDVPEYEADVTHVHRRPLRWWVSLFHQAGWSVEARYRVNGVKDNYAQYPTGNGFVTARRLAS